MVTVPPLSAVPVKVGVTTLVTLSVLAEPLSDAVVRSGTDGADGAVVSMVTDSPDDAAPTLPAGSVVLAVMLCVPEDSAEVLILYAPPVASPDPTATPSLK